MNSTHGREPRADTHDINQPKESPPRTNKQPAARGKKLALTFGTPLNSQRTDAQELQPFGLHPWRLLLLYTATGGSRWGAPSGWPLGPRGAERKLRPGCRRCQTAW